MLNSARLVVTDEIRLENYWVVGKLLLGGTLNTHLDVDSAFLLGVIMRTTTRELLGSRQATTRGY